jgi:mono/diheme cytochrome c family protein
MKRFLAVAVVMAFAGSLSWAADDGAAIYKTKCAACHGAAGEGKMGPALKGTDKSADEIVAVVTKGAEGKKAPHGKPMSGLTAEQAKAVADYVKTLK